MKRGNAADVFLLGAGFARAISREMPLLQDLAESVLRQRRSQRGVPAPVAAMMRENFAHALSYLEQPKPWVSEADNLRDRALYLEFTEAIARDLEATVARVTRRLGAGVPRWLARLIRHWHAHRCVVLTLNYDTLIETVATAIPVGDQPIDAPQIYPPLLTDAGFRASGPRPEQTGDSFRLLKLHGSTNWYFSGRGDARGEPIYFVPPLPLRRVSAAERREHEFRLNAVTDKYPLMVPPVYDKSALLTHETIRALWFEAGEALKNAQRVVCMGYSLPESDLTMRHFLQSTITDAAVVIADPGEEAARNFRRQFQGKRSQIKPFAHGARTIARFVEAELE